MFKLLQKALKTGSLTEALPIKKYVEKKFGGSVAIRHVDAGSCNACELEVHALNNSFYDLERFGLHFVASPRHADLLLVTGPVSRHMEEALRITYANVPEPKLVIAVGDCASGCGLFSDSYACVGAAAKVVPCNGCIKGCPPTPIKLLLGIFEIILPKETL
jgi:Ni,Fe-hydrogenase III small subunit